MTCKRKYLRPINDPSWRFYGLYSTVCEQMAMSVSHFWIKTTCKNCLKKSPSKKN